jgi:carbon-monoxide dehydrogenase small subunit|tara:strand:+ start:98 stop:589 length:492 start_codon:yes stop_codon:yes gene_type:complete
MNNTVNLSFNLNNKNYKSIKVPTCLTLADLLRDEFNLRGTNLSCNQGVCGSCTVLIDNKPIAACHTFAFEVEGKHIRTIEGLESAVGTLDPVQESFAELSAFQCGYCTPGMIMLSRALLDHNEDPTEEMIKEWISSNICRCTGYSMIIEAVQLAAKKIKSSKI